MASCRLASPAPPRGGRDETNATICRILDACNGRTPFRGSTARDFEICFNVNILWRDPKDPT
jgi:hypothetical protein